MESEERKGGEGAAWERERERMRERDVDVFHVTKKAEGRTRRKKKKNKRNSLQWLIAIFVHLCDEYGSHSQKKRTKTSNGRESVFAVALPWRHGPDCSSSGNAGVALPARFWGERRRLECRGTFPRCSFCFHYYSLSNQGFGSQKKQPFHPKGSTTDGKSEMSEADTVQPQQTKNLYLAQRLLIIQARSVCWSQCLREPDHGRVTMSIKSYNMMTHTPGHERTAFPIL